MKKTILTLLSFIAITGISYSQLPVPGGGAIADSFELTGVTYTNNGVVYDYSGPGWYYRGGGSETYFVRPNSDGTWDHIWFEGGDIGRAATTDADLPHDWNNIFHDDPNVSMWSNCVVNPGYMGTPEQLAWNDYGTSGSSWVMGNLAPTPTPTPTPSATPTPTPTPAVPGVTGAVTGGVTVRAQKLNIGLTFSNGQWIPSNP